MKKWKWALQIVGCLGLGFLLFLFCQHQTQGFRPYFLLSNLPNDPEWEVPPLSAEEEAQIQARLHQEFRLIGQGGWCFAFLGEDGKTILKFYKHRYFHPLEMWRHFEFKNLFLKSSPWPQGMNYPQRFNFESCTLLYTRARERTGLLYVHLNKTKTKHHLVTLVDAIGIRHQIDLDKTEFVVQERADLLLPTLEALKAEGNLEKSKKYLDSLLECLVFFLQKGIRDSDTGMRKNFGFIQGYAITMDISSFVPDPTLLDPKTTKAEIQKKTVRIARWLRKYYPSLYSHYEKRLENL